MRFVGLASDFMSIVSTRGASRLARLSSTSEANDLPDGLMDVPQVAEYLRVSKKSVYKLIDRLKIPAIRIGGLLRVRKDELDETLRAWRR